LKRQWRRIPPLVLTRDGSLADQLFKEHQEAVSAFAQKRRPNF
jgi:hypothetical protein